MTPWLVVCSLAPALAGWTSEPVAEPGAVRAVGLVADGWSGERFAVLDALAGGRPVVQWVGSDGATWTDPVVVADTGWAWPAMAMVTIATSPGSTTVVVGSRVFVGSGDGNFEVVTVDRGTGRALEATLRLSDDLADVDQGRLSLLDGGAELHACFTAHSASDDLVLNHTVGGVWQDPRRLGTAPVLSGVQDHCGLALRPGGGRVVVNHTGGPDRVHVTLESAPGRRVSGFPAQVLGGDGLDYDHPTVALAAGGDGEAIHLVASVADDEGYGVVHATCRVRAGVSCASRSDWSRTEVVPAGALPHRPWPEVEVDAGGAVYVAWVEEDRRGTDRVRVASRCPGAAAFVDTGTVEAGPGEQAFGSDGAGGVDNRALAAPRLAVDEGRGEVGIAYLLVGGGSATPMNAWSPLATCP